jgi:hypothetical protein
VWKEALRKPDTILGIALGTFFVFLTTATEGLDWPFWQMLLVYVVSGALFGLAFAVIGGWIERTRRKR